MGRVTSASPDAVSPGGIRVVSRALHGFDRLSYEVSRRAYLHCPVSPLPSVASVENAASSPHGEPRWVPRPGRGDEGACGRRRNSAPARIKGGLSRQPNRPETFKFSSDPQFMDKVRDTVGLLDFLMEIDRRVTDDLDIHIVMDNHATRKRGGTKSQTSECCIAILLFRAGVWRGSHLGLWFLLRQSEFNRFKLHLSTRYHLGGRHATIRTTEIETSAGLLYLPALHALHRQGDFLDFKNGVFTTGSTGGGRETDVKRPRHDRQLTQVHMNAPNMPCRVIVHQVDKASGKGQFMHALGTADQSAGPQPWHPLPGDRRAP